MGASCTSVFMSVQYPDLKARNEYNSVYSGAQQNKLRSRSIAQDVFDNDESLFRKNSNMISMIGSKQLGRFRDVHFDIRANYLSRLYDYEKKNMVLYDKKNQAGSSLFKQQELQFSYLSSVLYFLAENKDLLGQQVLITKIINEYHIYCFNLFCNGEQHKVIIDDQIPQSGDKLLHSTLKGKQIWPILLEKAWCKQIGGYLNARGLSPQECFEEILGAPAYSYPICTKDPRDPEYHDYCQMISDKIIDSLKQGYFISAVARDGLESIKNKQVFVVYDYKSDGLKMTSPFSDFHHKSKDSDSSNGIKITFSDFMDMFDYLIIGYYKQGYEPMSMGVKSKRRQQRLIMIDVKDSEDISIRFTQFYEGYLADAFKDSYQYSPLVLFELYDSNKDILTTCQGCEKTFSGAHSSYFSRDIFHNLRSGRYYLRLEVQWENEDVMDMGRVVVYGSRGNIQVSQQLISENQKKMIFELHESSLHNMPNTIKYQNQNSEYEVKILQKEIQAVVSIQNLTKQAIVLELTFTDSHNIRIKYAKMKSKKLVLKLPPQTTKIFEIVPENMRQRYEIKPFDIKTLEHYSENS